MKIGRVEIGLIALIIIVLLFLGISAWKSPNYHSDPPTSVRGVQLAYALRAYADEHDSYLPPDWETLLTWSKSKRKLPFDQKETEELFDVAWGARLTVAHPPLIIVRDPTSKQMEAHLNQLLMRTGVAAMQTGR